jgi:glycosyltransferase involved in cell wall biosynthesis
MSSDFSSVNIILASYNGEKYIQKQLESILNQTYPIASIHVFDDCSTDNTVHMLREFERQGQIHLHINNKNIGLIENFKRGIQLLSKDGYIALSDQDDIWDKRKIEDSVLKMCEIENDPFIPALVYSDLIVINHNDDIVAKSFWKETNRSHYKHCLETVLFSNVVNGCTILFNSAMAKFARDIPDKIIQNHDAWLALIAFSFGQVGIINKATVNYRQHQENITFSVREKKESSLKKIKKNIVFLFKPSLFLTTQLDLIKSFYLTYEKRIDVNQKLLFERFLKLRGRNYLTQKHYILDVIRKSNR